MLHLNSSNLKDHPIHHRTGIFKYNAINDSKNNNVKSRKILVFFVIFGLLMSLTILISNSNDQINSLEPDPPYPKIFQAVLIGDSLTEQSVDRNGYASILNAQGRRKVEYIVRGFAGWTSKDIRDEIKPILHNINADIAFLLIGTNDAKADKSKGCSVDEYSLNLKFLINKIQKHVTHIYLVTPHPVNTNEFQNIQDYSDAMKSIASQLNLNLVDTTNIIKFEDLFDGVHFNDNGHSKMAALYQQVVDKYNLPMFLHGYE